MKLNHLNLSVSVISLFLVLAVSCRKPDKPKPQEPCKNLVTVTAISPVETGDRGQFLYDAPDGQRYFLNAENWSDYSARLVYGVQYKMAFREVPCRKCGTTTEQGNGIREGGCLVFPVKCIRILCVQEIKGCFETRMNVADYDNEISQCNSVAGINGDKLQVNISYSGCSADDKLNYTLDLQEMYRRCIGGSPIYEAKVVNQFKGYTCKALFTRDICFDLTPLKNYYMLMNSLPPKEILIRVLINGQYQELTYKL